MVYIELTFTSDFLKCVPWKSTAWEMLKSNSAEGKKRVLRSNTLFAVCKIHQLVIWDLCNAIFILLMGFSRQEYQSGLPFPSPVGHILSELSTMIHPSWMALHGMAHSFIELDKAVVHVINLVSFLRLLFSFCLPLMNKDKRLMILTAYDQKRS